MARVEAKVSDGRVLDLIRGWLKADILKGLETWTPTQGSPQGAVISPLLANIYLDPLDAFIAERGYRMARYADDFVILCRTREEAEAALEDVRAWVTMNGLALHPEKTHVGDCRQPGQGFEFLGYRFEAGERHVRKKSLNKLKDSIRAKTTAHARRQPRAHRGGPQPDAARLVRLLQARPSENLRRQFSAEKRLGTTLSWLAGFEARGRRAANRCATGDARCATGTILAGYGPQPRRKRLRLSAKPRRQLIRGPYKICCRASKVKQNM